MNKSNYRCLLIILLISTYTFCNAQDQPTLQQVGPLFCFGQNIVGAQKFFLSGTFAYQKFTCDVNFLALRTRLLYGFTDKLSAWISIPFKVHSSPSTRSVVGDIGLRTEYAYVKKITDTYIFQPTIVLGVDIPHNTSITPINSGTPSFFLGSTASYLSKSWYFYGSLGGQIFTRQKKPVDHAFENFLGKIFDANQLPKVLHAHTTFKPGNYFLYECCIGHSLPKIFGWHSRVLLEFNGILIQKDSYDVHVNTELGECDTKAIDNNSGGNTIFLGPSLFLASKHWVIQAGIQWPIVQRLFGCCQLEQKMRAAFLISYEF